jgi:hypothetical protein
MRIVCVLPRTCKKANDSHEEECEVYKIIYKNTMLNFPNRFIFMLVYFKLPFKLFLVRALIFSVKSESREVSVSLSRNTRSPHTPTPSKLLVLLLKLASFSPLPK